QDDRGKRGSEEQNILVNEGLLREHPGEPITATVRLHFEHLNTRYQLSRSIQGVLNKQGGIDQQDGRVELREVLPSGNHNTIDDPLLVAGRVSKILNEKIRDYFLFDGERIERL